MIEKNGRRFRKYFCGNKDWICISSYSEYDYIFVNVNKSSKFFGGTRHVINNCTIDKRLTNHLL